MALQAKHRLIPGQLDELTLTVLTSHSSSLDPGEPKPPLAAVSSSQSVGPWGTYWVVVQ